MFLFFLCVREFLISGSQSTSLDRCTVHFITTTVVRNSENGQRHYAMCYVLCQKPYLSEMFETTVRVKGDKVTDPPW
jgi:hypothetical protein